MSNLFGLAAICGSVLISVNAVDAEPSPICSAEPVRRTDLPPNTPLPTVPSTCRPPMPDANTGEPCNRTLPSSPAKEAPPDSSSACCSTRSTSSYWSPYAPRIAPSEILFAAAPPRKDEPAATSGINHGASFVAPRLVAPSNAPPASEPIVPPRVPASPCANLKPPVTAGFDAS